MATNMIVKITDGKDIRRFTTSTVNLTYNAIHKHAVEAFGLGSKDFKLMYKDDEGDQITMSTDAEIQEAVGITLKLEPPVLRLTLVPQRSASPKPAAAASNPNETPELAALFKNIKAQLPSLLEHLPQTLKDQLPSAELDIAATIAATAEAAGYGGANPATNPDMEGYHPGVTCDKTNMSPIVGTRYNLKGHDWDLCEAEYNKLPDAEKANFVAIPPPAYRLKARPARAQPKDPNPKGFHPGVTCDKSGQCPIFGWRYHLKDHNYDLCEAEFNKLPDADKPNYEKLAPPMACWGGGGGRGGKWGGKWGGCGGGGWGGGAAGWGGPGWGGPAWNGHAWAHAGPHGGWAGGWGGKGGGPRGGCGGAPDTHDSEGAGRNGGREAHGEHKLAARFVCDVAIFDGTQMAPGTKFTKIWRLKNTGEVAWPPGTQIIFVGGDQMKSSLTVPLSRQGPVMPGEEVDCSVDLVAPEEHGRYVGYWRLTGPYGRKKWGQRFWCHVHVVDPRVEPTPPTDKEMEEMAQAASDRENDDGAEDPPEPDAEGGVAEEAASEDGDMVMVSAPDTEATVTALMQATTMIDEGAPPAAAAAPMADATMDAPTSAAAASSASPAAAPAPAPALTPAVEMAETLGQMGFNDPELVQHVIEKNGPDLDACVRDLALVNENQAGLQGLLEMGFQDAKLNAKLMIKNGGSLKATVRDLVADEDF